MILDMNIFCYERGKIVSKCIMFLIAIKNYCSLLTPHVLGEDMDQLTSLCKGLMVFVLGAKAFLMSTVNSVGKKKSHLFSILRIVV